MPQLELIDVLVELLALLTREPCWQHEVSWVVASSVLLDLSLRQTKEQIVVTARATLLVLTQR